MKKTCILFSLAATMLAGCTKNTTTNNITTPLPAFVVDGIHDVSMTNGTLSEADLVVTVTYSDSSQESVSLSLSSLPAGITIDPSWITNGIPTFTTDLYFYDTTTNGATPGTYPMTLTATGTTTGVKTYMFNIKVSAAQPCTTFIVGKYNSCSTSCTGFSYADSVYADPTVVNKIWFTNFDNTGNKIYGLYSCGTEEMTIPSQTVGGITYSGSGSGFGSTLSHSITLEVETPTNSCEINMH